MNVKKYTDQEYVPASELKPLGATLLDQITDYRQSFIEIISLDNLDFATIVETPSLVKKRFNKNIDIKDKIDFIPKSNDYLLEIAIAIVKNKLKFKIDAKIKKRLLDLFYKNNKDMTIITNYLTNNIEALLKIDPEKQITKIAPQLSKKETRFINKYHQINHNYDLNDFIELNRSSYETARRSLEKLASLKFYSKSKVGRKFIYKPTKKIFQIMKGQS